MSTDNSKFDKLRAASLVAAGTAMVFFAGVWVARAEPGGATAQSLSFAGTLRQNGAPMTGTQSVTFAFKKGSTTVCAPLVSVSPDSTTGAFRADIPLSSCPGTLFDGSDVKLDISVGGAIVAQNQSVNPVPYAKYADSVGVSDCPVGYVRETATPTAIVCKADSGDQVVRVGTGPSAFWIDQFEASVWDVSGASPVQYGAAADNYPSTFPKNGQWTQKLVARSLSSVAPSAHITWFQANEACRAAGKRLPTASEWMAAARGTVDGAGCNLTSKGKRNTGGGSACRSSWGAEDMIGNLWELTDEWYAGVGDATQLGQPWPSPIYNADGTYNIASKTSDPNGASVGLPSIAERGGDSFSNEMGGLFALSLSSAPSNSGAQTGFRCVTPR